MELRLLLRALLLLGCIGELGCAAGKGKGRRPRREQRGEPEGGGIDAIRMEFGVDPMDAEPLAQCSMQLDECRSFVRESIGDGGGGQDGAKNAGPAREKMHALAETEFLALTRAATDAANASAMASIRTAPHLAAEYEKNGQVTLRTVWPRSVAQLAYQELEEVWEHYRLPATFSGTAFVRAEKDNPRIEGSAEFPPFDRLYSLEERSPSLRRLITSAGLGEIAAELMGVDSVSLYMSSYFRK